MKYNSDFIRYFSKEKCFTFGDLKRFLIDKGATEAYAKLFAHKMLKSGRIFRLTNGVYSFSNDEAVIGFAFPPFYYGLEYALTIRKLWTQVSNPVVITASKAMPGIRESMGKRIVVRRISKRMFFGFEYVRFSGIFVPVSDLEKTIVDLIYYRIGIGGEVERLVALADKRKLMRYAEKAGIRKKVMAAIKNNVSR